MNKNLEAVYGETMMPGTGVNVVETAVSDCAAAGELAPRVVLSVDATVKNVKTRCVYCILYRASFCNPVHCITFDCTGFVPLLSVLTLSLSSLSEKFFLCLFYFCLLYTARCV